MKILDHFIHLDLSTDQLAALKKIDLFLNSDIPVFMLKGYAGSGKTTILQGLIEYLKSIDQKFKLIAPTGRAAKVIRDKTGGEASTIHRAIYSYQLLSEVAGIDTEETSFLYYFKIRSEEIRETVFIVDESSMISDVKNDGEFFRFGTGYLLTDLITYSRVSYPLARTKIIFVGDPFQLSPVGDSSSKAFEPAYLSDKFDLKSDEVEMREVKRQRTESGILGCASKIRKSLSSGFFNDFNLSAGSTDMHTISNNEFINTWSTVPDPKIVIASKNRTCKYLNSRIREFKYGISNAPLKIGDTVIMGGNNYRKNIFNGEFAVVNQFGVSPTVRIIRFNGKKKSGTAGSVKVVHEITLTWLHVELIFPDVDSGSRIIKGQVLENFLYSDGDLKPLERRALYIDFKKRHPQIEPKSDLFTTTLLEDDFYNSILMKYGYAVTCHKAQGGEWDNVITVWDHDNSADFNYFSDQQKRAGKTNADFFRWSYTAITRASKNLYAINPPSFNSYSNLTIVDHLANISFEQLAIPRLRTTDINYTQDSISILTKFNLQDQPFNIQDHFLKVEYTVGLANIEIIGWEKKNFELFYKFKQGDGTAGVKTWINKDNVFNNKYLELPAWTSDSNIYKDLEPLLKTVPNITIIRDQVLVSKQETESIYEFEENLPFTKSLYEDLRRSLNKQGVFISRLEHLRYRERYTFQRNNEIATFDFEYSDNGFFGRVLSLSKYSNSEALQNDLIIVFKGFNNVSHGK